MSIFKKLFGSKKTINNQHTVPPTTTKEQGLLHHIYWNFATKKFDDLSSFSKELVDYNNTINPGNNLDADRIFNATREITVQYMYWGIDEDGDEDQLEVAFTVKTENENGFSVNEFLFKVHNHICEQMTENDATFFEGLTPYDNGSETPFFFLNQGS